MRFRPDYFFNMTVNRKEIYAKLFKEITRNTDINNNIFRAYSILICRNDDEETRKHSPNKINTVRCSAADLASEMGTKWDYAKKYLDTMAEWRMISPVEEYGKKNITLWSFNEIDDFEIPSKKVKNIK